MLKEYGKIVNGEFMAVAAEECPEGMKEVIRDAIIPEDADIIYEETETTIHQTYKKEEPKPSEEME